MRDVQDVTKDVTKPLCVWPLTNVTPGPSDVATQPRTDKKWWKYFVGRTFRTIVVLSFSDFSFWNSFQLFFPFSLFPLLFPPCFLITFFFFFPTSIEWGVRHTHIHTYTRFHISFFLCLSFSVSLSLHPTHHGQWHYSRAFVFSLVPSSKVWPISLPSSSQFFLKIRSIVFPDKENLL